MALEKITEIQNWQTVIKESQQREEIQCQPMKHKYKDGVKCKKVKMLENYITYEINICEEISS